ncbi:MAG TPA: hypothetical protein VGL53_22725 [Bryobacteraceae bacterium]
MLLSCGTLCAQDQDPVPPADPKPATQSATPPEGTAPAPLDKRIFAVLPNYRTADGNLPYEPISSKRKLWIGFKDSFDYPIFITSAIYSSFYQLQDSHPQFGQGMEGYAKRYLASSTDLVVGNFMSESIFPILLKEDPRYFAVGPAYGGVWKRAGYALTRVLVCKTDTGKATFNYSEILGNSTAVALSNVYYSDTRDARDAAQALGTQVATDALSNLLKEFWPDVKRKFFNKKSTPAND